MIKWCSIVALLTALACSDLKPFSLSRADSSSAEPPVAMDHFTLTGQTPLRTDTVRDSAGKVLVFRGFRARPLALTRAGNIAALDPENKQLFLFDTSGRQVKRVALTGVDAYHPASPTEMFVLPGDSIAVWDSHAWTMSVFDASLKLDRVDRPFTRSGPQFSWRRTLGRLGDGRWVALVSSRQSDLRSFFSDIETFVDKQTLTIGRADEAPSDFYRLASRRGLLTRKDSNTFIWSTSSEGGLGAVCEYGVLLLDSDSVRVVDVRGRVKSVVPIPRRGDTIRTAADRARIVDVIMTGFNSNAALASDKSLARKVRAGLTKQVSTLKVQARSTMIDVNGRLWYFRRDTTHLPLHVYDRVDRAGQPEAAFMYDGWGGEIGTASVVDDRLRMADTTRVITITHFAEPFASAGDKSLGRCSASFYY